MLQFCIECIFNTHKTTETPFNITESLFWISINQQNLLKHVCEVSKYRKAPGKNNTNFCLMVSSIF